MKQVKLRKYDNSHYKPGNNFKKVLWYIVNMLVFKTMFPFPSGSKVKILRLFGAKIGIDVIIKPNVNIKYPWFLTIGDNCWIGENVWIDNLAMVTLGDNVCISQGAYFLLRRQSPGC